MSGRIALSFHAREKRGEHERSHRRVLWRARHRRNISGIRQGYRCIGIGERECVLVQGGQHVPTNPRSEGHSGLRSRISAYFVTVPDRHAQPCYLHAGHPLPVESPGILLNGHRYRHDPFLPERGWLQPAESDSNCNSGIYKRRHRGLSHHRETMTLPGKTISHTAEKHCLSTNIEAKHWNRVCAGVPGGPCRPAAPIPLTAFWRWTCPCRPRPDGRG